MARKQAVRPALFPVSALQSAPAHRTVSAPTVVLACPVDLEDLASWAAAHQARPARLVTGGLRFAFYWRCSTEDN
ncbi:hypothetical protein Caci_3859 [Catenulispora acidiphila DSM 44928]|uniref:Uncharacterized protein n=1 Tax=Catenulispora acidiphila (strain DSM 44928 / JCM 14897 / NBRC 102108 / NRRL B-24433 / ID139908) TaxID=479433 RepID=C7QDG0_CATAD|nr:hypothetical protein [Catenulispora acidiphila]ACU72753.1 hypothetical protein Caci_3859 [Catenulispora acidiphila DSM 44928]